MLKDQKKLGEAHRKALGKMALGYGGARGEKGKLNNYSIDQNIPGKRISNTSLNTSGFISSGAVKFKTRNGL
jgi:hypothetical protein